jgi:hypothetical protein
MKDLVRKQPMGQIRPRLHRQVSTFKRPKKVLPLGNENPLFESK